MSSLEKIKTEILDYNEKIIELTRLTQIIDQFKNPLVKKIRKEFVCFFTELFKANPKVKNFGWSQFTPFYNGGDPCEFSAQLDDIKINNKYLCESKLDYDIYVKFEKILETIPQEFYFGLFGDHKNIIVHCNGNIKITKCDHE